MPAIYGSVLK